MPTIQGLVGYGRARHPRRVPDRSVPEEILKRYRVMLEKDERDGKQCIELAQYERERRSVQALDPSWLTEQRWEMERCVAYFSKYGVWPAVPRLAECVTCLKEIVISPEPGRFRKYCSDCRMKHNTLNLRKSARRRYLRRKAERA